MFLFQPLSDEESPTVFNESDNSVIFWYFFEEVFSVKSLMVFYLVAGFCQSILLHKMNLNLLPIDVM